MGRKEDELKWVELYDATQEIKDELNRLDQAIAHVFRGGRLTQGTGPGADWRLIRKSLQDRLRPLSNEMDRIIERIL